MVLPGMLAGLFLQVLGKEAEGIDRLRRSGPARLLFFGFDVEEGLETEVVFYRGVGVRGMLGRGPGVGPEVGQEFRADLLFPGRVDVEDGLETEPHVPPRPGAGGRTGPGRFGLRRLGRGRRLATALLLLGKGHDGHGLRSVRRFAVPRLGLGHGLGPWIGLDVRHGQQGMDRGHELEHVQGFFEILRGAVSPQGLGPVDAVLVDAGHDEDGHLADRILGDPVAELEAMDLGQHGLHEDEVGLFGLEFLPAGLAVAGQDDLEPFLGQGLVEVLQGGLVIVDDKNLLHAHLTGLSGLGCVLSPPIFHHPQDRSITP